MVKAEPTRADAPWHDVSEIKELVFRRLADGESLFSTSQQLNISYDMTRRLAAALLQEGRLEESIVDGVDMWPRSFHAPGTEEKVQGDYISIRLLGFAEYEVIHRGKSTDFIWKGDSIVGTWKVDPDNHDDAEIQAIITMNGDPCKVVCIADSPVRAYLPPIRTDHVPGSEESWGIFIENAEQIRKIMGGCGWELAPAKLTGKCTMIRAKEVA